MPKNERWPLYDAAICAGREHPLDAWWPELAPLTSKERILVHLAIRKECEQGFPAELPCAEQRNAFTGAYP